MDGWICVNIGGRECGGRAQLLPRNANQVSTAFGENRVAWFGLLGLLVACFFDGWSVDNGGWGWMRKWMECKQRREGVRARAQRLPHNANQVSTAFGKTQGCVVLVAGFVGCLVGYQCKASIDSIWGKRLVAWFVCCWWATCPFILLSFLWLVRPWFRLLGLLVAWIWRKHIQ